MLNSEPETDLDCESGLLRLQAATDTRHDQQQEMTHLTPMANRQKIVDRSTPDVDALYSKPLPSTRSGPLYNAFSYPTKISPEAIAVFIATHTRPGSKILDVFGGSGTTGLATLLCDKPTEVMIRMAGELGVEPEWGPREAEVYELSTLGSFVAKVLCAPPDPAEFAKAAKRFIALAEERFGWIYSAEGPDGQPGRIRYTIWSDVLSCHHCGAETSYWDAAVRRDPLRLSDRFECPNCGKEAQVDSCSRMSEAFRDPLLGRNLERKKRVPVRVYGASDGANWSRDATAKDVETHSRVAGEAPSSCAPIAEIEWGDLYRSGYHKGISHLHHFYTPRNFFAISALWELISEFPENVRDALRLLVLSYNSTHSTLMTRVVIKQGMSDFVLTGAQSGVLYVSGLPVEKNVFDGIKRKASSLRKAFETVAGSRSSVRVTNASSESLAVADESVDYVFTDPPFGDYIPYAEINQLNEFWLGRNTDRASEIIVSGAQGKSVNDYGKMMARVFREVSRVLKPGGRATVVFHSAKASVWQSLAEAYLSAGLSVRATSVLDKIQASFKQVVSTVSVKGDPLLLLAKGNPKGCAALSSTAEEVADEILRSARTAKSSERDPQRLYSRFVSRCLEIGVSVHMGAKEFYGRAETALQD